MRASDVVDAESRTDDAGPRFGWFDAVARNRMRILKSLVGLALLSFVARHVLRNFILASSSEAMVICDFIDVTAPIEGYARREPAEIGAILPANQRLGSISNPRIDKTAVAELQASIESLDGEIKAMRSVAGMLRTLGGKFEARGRSYRTGRAAQLASLLEQSQARIDADRARVGASESHWHRAVEMSKLGFGSDQSAEEAERDAAVARKSLAANEHEHESLVATLSALKEGVSLSDSSGMDRSYSSQRGDDVALRLTQIEGTLAEKEARREALQEQLAAQRSQVAALSDALITLPKRARVWSLAAADGVFVTRGAPFMRLVDCSALRVLAYLPEHAYNRLRPGNRADVVLQPDGSRYTAAVEMRLGAPDVRLVPQVALSTAPDQRQAYAVIVSSPELDAALAQRCDVGQNAEVLFHPGAN